MSVISPQAMLLWATLSSTLLLFLVQHLYRYDRFQCLKWRSSSDGGFKRFMTFSYIISVPLLVTYSVAMAVMKYQAGYKSFPNPASTPAKPLPRIIVATPTEMWPQAHQDLVFPLYVIFAVAWALEIVSHLEELCFWLFMIKEQGGGEGECGVRPWFKSFEYKLWCCGSVGALVLLPLVTIQTRKNVQQVEAWTFFAGSIGSLVITLWFIQVLWKFPAFLKRIQAEDAEPEVIVRLVAFQDLNRLRVVFRLMFVLPLLVLACDGLQEYGPHVINKTAGAADILAMVGGIGCVVSSVITLLVFFPRSIAREAGYATRARTHTSQMQSKSGAAPVTKSQPRPARQTTSIPRPPQPLSPGSSNFQSVNGITSQLRSPGVGELRSPGSAGIQRPPAAHRRTTSNSGPAPALDAGGDPLTSTASSQQPPALRIPRRPYASPATPDDAPDAGVQVTVHTTTRGDSQYCIISTLTSLT
ncbi:hypothetical protein BDV93DRAFT_526390 [Ceratobasidium sp. AG-I]|nr:hypothetical protein BDV93DRAFT_526390 [Ceratobasidium sp. AG-I]